MAYEPANEADDEAALAAVLSVFELAADSDE
ncbi:hypothetical protein predicted by Glimmer/Critica [Lactiplantibacillus plantarum]|nr:hypothetical protein predicted by Glimmer/Critica [Lactiplantibacillus plantarum]